MKPASHSPLYVVFFPQLAEIARSHGYAMAAHGSIASDFDLICIPWVNDAADPEDVVKKIGEEFSFPVLGNPSDREHGRRVWTLSMGGPGYIDLSFTPRLHAEHDEALEKAAGWHDQRACNTPSVFEQEFHEVSAKTIRDLKKGTPNADK